MASEIDRITYMYTVYKRNEDKPIYSIDIATYKENLKSIDSYTIKIL